MFRVSKRTMDHKVFLNEYHKNVLVILTFITFKTNKSIIKAKAIPLQAWTGPEGSRRLRLPDFKTIGT
jgi:hypothetical protein